MKNGTKVAVIFTALAFVLVLALRPETNNQYSATDKVPGTHPAYFEQFKTIKQNANGELPTDPWINWMKADRLMKKGSDFIETINEVGPDHVGGRTRALIIDKDNSSRLYAGGVSGGLWISNDKGSTWQQVDDEAPTLSITAIVQNPFDPQEIYYTVGEPTGNSAGIQTNGFFRSTDKGENFEYIQPKGTQSFSSTWDIEHSKTRENVIYVGTHSQGVSVSVDGGDSFYRLPASGGKVHDVDAFPDSTVWYTIERNGVYVYDERTQATKKLTGGLPSGGFTRVLVERSPTFPNVAYAAFATTSSQMHSVYKTSDGGNSWTKLTNPPRYYNFEWYCLTLGMHPVDTNFVVLAGQQPAFSDDGGKTWKGLSRSHADYHSLAFFENSDEYIVGNDGGVHIYDKTTSNKNFIDINEGYNVTQFYAGAFGPGPTDLIIGGTQDNGTWITREDEAEFDKVYGADGSYCAISQQTKVAYLSSQNGNIRRTDTNFRSTTSLYGFLNSKVSSTSDYWFINPFEINPVDGDQIYFPTRRNLYRSYDQGNTWEQITNRTPSNAYSVGIVPELNPTVYVGGANGLLRRVDEAVTAERGDEYDLRDFAPSQVRAGFIGNIEIDPVDSGVIYLALNNYGNSDKIWKVEKADKDSPVFTSISGNMPENLPVNWLEVNPKNTKQIMAATDFGLYVTDDGGENWEKIDAIPNVQIPQIRLKEENNKLYIFTHGRGVWVAQLEKEPINVEEVDPKQTVAQITVFPNPTSDYIRLSKKASSNIRIVDLSGKTHELRWVSDKELDVRHLAKGTYFLINDDKANRFTSKFVKL